MIAKAFATDAVPAYETPKSLLTDNSKQTPTDVFQHVCQILGIAIVSKTIYHPQLNSPTERYNRTFRRRCVSSLPTPFWDTYAESVAFAYNTYPHESKILPPLNFSSNRH